MPDSKPLIFLPQTRKRSCGSPYTRREFIKRVIALGRSRFGRDSTCMAD